MRYEDYWKINSTYGNLFYERAIGQKEEMECSKALCKILKPIYKEGMSVLDVGCGTGHYLRSLIEHLDEDIKYTGVDITKEYMVKAKKAFKNYSFKVGNIHCLEFLTNEFDIVTCNNVLMHLPVPPTKAISELLRVSKDYVVIRTPIGKRNYIIKQVNDFNDELDKDFENKLPKQEHKLIDENGEPICWHYLNLYTKRFFEDLILEINPDYTVNFIQDTFWKELKTKSKTNTATEIIDGKQVCGNVVLDWHFIVIRK